MLLDRFIWLIEVEAGVIDKWALEMGFGSLLIYLWFVVSLKRWNDVIDRYPVDEMI
jgi:hypothetical protein